MTKEEIMDAAIKARGFEDEITIWFCELCETTDNTEFLEEKLKEVLIMPII